MKLSINIDHVATLRQQRREKYPDPVSAAIICEKVGVDGIVCHLREDRRHIQDRDVFLLRDTLKTKFDLEMGASEEIIKIALQVVPDLVTLVPEKREELTTEGGLNILSQKDYLKKTISRFHEKNIPVSLFVEPDKNVIEVSKLIGCDFVELHTGVYANATTKEEIEIKLKQISEAAQFANSIGLKVNAGHGLDYTNILPIIKLNSIYEVSIGYSVITRALFVGLEKAVREMLNLVKGI
ncbi:MAG: pyridoxine 5'-phosphate synthase [Bacteroidetes bacterium]|nr:pyridoxine 5'-phosphate synthase [Bacteroidota bacterium]